MTRILRQSTTADVRIGPFVDKDDGLTPETGITLGAADEAEALRAGTATLDIAALTWAAIAGADGWYTLSLSTTATNTVGELVIVVHDDSVCLPVWASFYVVEEAVYDAFFAASAGMAVTLATGAVTAAVIANGAIDAATFAADVDAEILSYIVDDATRIDASALNTASVTSIPAILVDTAEIGAAGAGLTVLATAAALATVDNEIAVIDGIVDSILVDTGTTLDAAIAAVKADTAAILTDTNELQTDWVNGGRLDLILDARASQASVDDLPTNAELATSQAAADDATLAAIAALNNISAAQVNAEVVDALATDTYAEPGQGTPAATASLATKVGYLFKAWRNRSTQTSTEYALYGDDAVTKDQEAVVSDDNSTFDRGEISTGA